MAFTSHLHIYVLFFRSHAACCILAGPMLVCAYLYQDNCQGKASACIRQHIFWLVSNSVPPTTYEYYFVDSSRNLRV